MTEQTAIRSIVGGHAALTLCHDHMGVLLSAVGGTIEVLHKVEGPCALCRSVDGAYLDTLRSGDAEAIHGFHQMLGRMPVESVEEALREIAVALLMRLAVLQLGNVQLDDLRC